eukprot:1007749-Rhodomonas_salina.2
MERGLGQGARSFIPPQDESFQQLRCREQVKDPRLCTRVQDLVHGYPVLTFYWFHKNTERVFRTKLALTAAADGHK